MRTPGPISRRSGAMASRCPRRCSEPAIGTLERYSWRQMRGPRSHAARCGNRQRQLHRAGCQRNHDDDVRVDRVRRSRNRRLRHCRHPGHAQFHAAASAASTSTATAAPRWRRRRRRRNDGLARHRGLFDAASFRSLALLEVVNRKAELFDQQAASVPQTFAASLAQTGGATSASRAPAPGTPPGQACRPLPDRLHTRKDRR